MKKTASAVSGVDVWQYMFHPTPVTGIVPLASPRFSAGAFFRKGMLTNNREHDLRVIAARAMETATRQEKPELLALFEKTITYRSQTAKKAVATRKKNQALAPEPAPASTNHPT